MPGSQPGPDPQAEVAADGSITYRDPVTDLGEYTLPAGSPGAQLLAGPRAAAAAGPRTVPAGRLIVLPPRPGSTGRLVKNPDGTMGVTPYNLPAPKAVLQVHQPFVPNTDPPDNRVIQGQSDGSYVVYPLSYFGLGITSTSGDEGQINAALLQSLPAGRPVRLAPYVFLTQGPVVMPYQGNAGSLLSGSAPAPGVQSGGAGGGLFGSVITPQAGWSGGGLSSAAAIYMANSQGGNFYGGSIQNLNVDLRSSPAGTFGLSILGGCEHYFIRDFCVLGNSADTTADAIHVDPDVYVGLPRGHWDHVTTQNHGRYGFWHNGQDTTLYDVHVQAASSSITDSGCFYFPGSGDLRLVACRADQGVYGYIFDSNPGGVINTPGGSITLVGCGSQNTYKNAMWLRNTSATGQQMRTPVSCTRCNFDFPGRDLASYAIQVDGVNTLTMDNCVVANGGTTAQGAYPVGGIKTSTIGTGPGKPLFIELKGGWWAVAGAGATAMINDAAVSSVITYNFWGVIGGPFINTTVLTQFKSANA